MRKGALHAQILQLVTDKRRRERKYLKMPSTKTKAGACKQQTDKALQINPSSGPTTQKIAGRAQAYIRPSAALSDQPLPHRVGQNVGSLDDSAFQPVNLCRAVQLPADTLCQQ
jgi:hypothetical protein